jgi:di/tricarboxylate transporter
MEKNADFNPLDMDNYKLEKLPKIQKTGVEKWMMKVGGPVSILAFILLYFVVDIPFLNQIDVNVLGKEALARYKEIGEASFERSNYAMLAIFVAAIILWITEAIPNYLTSLFVILAIVLTNVTSQEEAFSQLGHPVMWLNILSFVLASMLVKTQAAKRFALWFVIKFGKNSFWVIFSFLVINIVLSAFISATTAKATILLPIFMVIAEIY